MIEAEHPRDETLRLLALREYEILDTDAEEAYDDLTKIAAAICGTPTALVSLLDEDRQWFKSRAGLAAQETPRRFAFCSHAILEPGSVFVVPDSSKDVRFFDNPLVTGEPHIAFYAGAPLVNPQGHALGTLCVIDQTPHELTEEQLSALEALARQVVSQLELGKTCRKLHSVSRDLARSNEELKEFTYIAAHDLQEPVRKLISFSQLLEKDLGEALPPRAAEDLGYIQDGARRMKQLISDLLDLSRTGTSPLSLSPVAAGDCARLAIDALSLSIQDRGADVRVEDLPQVLGDTTLLTQLFQNLIGNAVKFCDGDAPRVRVSFSVEDDVATFCVADNGIGMDPQFAEQIFLPFKRLHGRAEYAGTGIGLAIAKKAAERQGGRIWVESEPAKGSRFLFSLPLVEMPASALVDAGNR